MELTCFVTAGGLWWREMKMIGRGRLQHSFNNARNTGHGKMKLSQSSKWAPTDFISDDNASVRVEVDTIKNSSWNWADGLLYCMLHSWKKDRKAGHRRQRIVIKLIIIRHFRHAPCHRFNIKSHQQPTTRHQFKCTIDHQTSFVIRT